MSRVYNFSAGPAVLPEEVLKEAAAEMLDYQGCGMSVMEMSHRSSVFQEIIETAEADIRELMHIPENYKVLFLQGGASQQFAMIPMNLMKNKVADYIVTGQWAKKAAKEAEKYGEVHVIASSEDKTFSYIPDCSDLDISEDADYVHIICIFRYRQIGAIRNIAESLISTGSDRICLSVNRCLFMRFLCPLSSNDIICHAVLHQVHRNHGKLGRTAALKKKHLIILRNV